MQSIAGNTIAILSSRLLATYLVIEPASRLSYLGAWLSTALQEGASAGPTRAMGVYTLAALVQMGAGVWLWCCPERFAGWLLKPARRTEASEPQASAGWSPELLHAVAFSTLGLWILAETLEAALGDAVQIASFGIDSFRAGNVAGHVSLLLDGLIVLARVALGVYLLFGGPALARYVRRAWALARSAQQPHGQFPREETEEA